MWRIFLFILPLGLDTLGIAISLGIKSYRDTPEQGEHVFPLWLRSALLFSFAEMLMPLLGIALGYAVSLALSNVMHIVGPVILIGVGIWELVEETRERLQKRKNIVDEAQRETEKRLARERSEQPTWLRQLALAISISLDELAVGFSLGGLTGSILGSQALSPLIFCLLVGMQSFLVTIIGLTAGRLLRMRLKPIREWSELLSALLLIGLGIWLFFIE